MSEINVPILKCNRCGHSWVPRSSKEPKVCPSCNSPYWNKPYSRSDKINKKF